MMRLYPTQKQIRFASSLGITNAASISAKRLSKLIDQALAERKRQDDERVEQANETDMLALASEYTTLKKQSWRYHCGPVPDEWLFCGNRWVCGGHAPQRVVLPEVWG